MGQRPRKKMNKIKGSPPPNRKKWQGRDNGDEMEKQGEPGAEVREELGL